MAHENAPMMFLMSSEHNPVVSMNNQGCSILPEKVAAGLLLFYLEQQDEMRFTPQGQPTEEYLNIYLT